MIPPPPKLRFTLLARIAALTITLLAASSTLSAQSPENDPTLIQVEGGQIHGTSADGLLIFKGIPFAQPPVGPLRWRPPQPPHPWQGLREATTFAPDPAQSTDKSSPSTPTSEDCLYLNLWRPAASAAKPFPVMVWIYGGGLVRGGASLYPADALARQGILVVTFNYRLGRLGFFAHPALAHESTADLRGNYGYMDQLAALQWIQKNIAHFGGDPANVTIAGESAGGGSVLVLLTSPLARGLFQRAILESPGIPSPRAVPTPMRPLKAAESIALAYAQSLGIKGEDPSALAALRALPAETLCNDRNSNYVLAIYGGPEIPGLSHAIIDGRLVVQPPEATLRAAKQTMVPILVGANSYDIAASPARTKDALFAPFGPLAPQARELYDPHNNATLHDLIQSTISDESMVEPTRYLAQSMTHAGQPAYFFRFSYIPESLRGKIPGAYHAAEIPFVFNLPAMILKDKTTPADIAMARTLSAYWVNFIKTANPNAPNLPPWPPFNPATADVFNFTNTGPTLTPDPLKPRLDLWQSVWENTSPGNP